MSMSGLICEHEHVGNVYEQSTHYGEQSVAGWILSEGGTTNPLCSTWELESLFRGE